MLAWSKFQMNHSLLQAELGMTSQWYFYTICHFINLFAIIEKGLADIGYNASKHLLFYCFKLHMLLTLSGYILNYVVTLASAYDIKVVYGLLEGQSIGYTR